MATEDAAERLLAQIREKRAEVRRYVATELPRKRRLQNVAVMGGSLSALLTAAPAVGGKPFTAWLTGLMGVGRPSWQILCGAAAICSALVTWATQRLKSQNVDERVARAQGCGAKLEVLEIGLGTGQLDFQRAATEYMKCVEDAAFVRA
jgi:hypothetical protein